MYSIGLEWCRLSDKNIPKSVTALDYTSFKNIGCSVSAKLAKCVPIMFIFHEKKQYMYSIGLERCKLSDKKIQNSITAFIDYATLKRTSKMIKIFAATLEDVFVSEKLI
jgi:hypothetical protein